MRRVLLSVGVAVVLSFVSRPAVDVAAQTTGSPPPRTTQAQNAAKGTAVLRGSVVAADTGAPIRRATVRAISSQGYDAGVAVTDEQGRYEIRELPAGRHTVSASRGGFLSLQYGQRKPSDRGTPVGVTDGQLVERLDIALPRGGVVTGHVMDEFGEPLAEVQVHVLRSMMAPGGRRMIPAGRQDTTDDQGAFRIYGLTPGEYAVSATLRSQSFSMGPNGRPGPTSEQGYAPTYYPGTPSLTDAQRVVVGAGQEVAGLIFGLTPTRVARVSGRVVGGAPNATGGFVSMRLDDGLPLMGGGPAGPVQADGTFDIGGVPPGRYELRVQQPRPNGNNLDALEGLATVTVAGADLAGITIAMRPPPTLTGVIEFDGGVPANLNPAQVRVMPMPADPNGRMSFSGPPETRPDFTFVLKGLNTPAYLRVGGASGWQLQSITYNGQDYTDVPLPAAPGVDLRDVRVKVTQAVANVSGTVRDERGQVVLDATVLVFSADETKWTIASRFMRTGRPDTQGRFEVSLLPPHDNYRIIALQGLEDGQFYDPDFLAGIRERAERLALTGGEMKTVELRLK